MDREFSQAEMQDRSDQLRLILEHAPAFISYVGADDETYRFVSRSAAAILGRTPEEMVGRHVRDVIGQAEYDRIAPRLAPVFKGAPVSLDIPLQIPGKGTQFLHANYLPHFGPDGKVLGILAFILNLTERKRMEEELRQAQKMEAIGLLAGGIAHDFNNLLTVINGFAEMAQSALADARNDRALGMLREIHRAGERAAALTRQLLAYSRKQILSPRSLELNATLGSMEPMLHRLLRADVELSMRLSPDLAAIRMDANQLEQVVLNLALNACDAMPRGGRLTLETGNRDFGTEGRPGFPVSLRGGCVALAVSDTGAGIPPDIRQRIFEPYFTTKAPGKGTGLGLATVHGIVAQSGGHVEVASQPGKGSTFTVWFPAAGPEDETTSPVPAAAEAVRPLPNLSVFLIDDDDSVREYARIALESMGCRVVAAKSGGEALERLAGSPSGFDLLLTDMVMPGMNGPELWAMAKALNPAAKVVFMSGYAVESRIEGASAEGAPFLQKPFTPGQLARALTEAMAA